MSNSSSDDFAVFGQDSDQVLNLCSGLLPHLQSLKADAELREDVFAEAQIRQSLQMIEATALYGRLDLNQTRLDLRPLHPGDLLAKTINRVKSMQLVNNLEFELLMPSSMPLIAADSQVFEASLSLIWQGILGQVRSNQAFLTCEISKNSQDEVDLIMARSILPGSYQNAVKAWSEPAVCAKRLLAKSGLKMQKFSSPKRIGYKISVPISKQMQLV